MQAEFISSILLPLGLAFIMFSLGIGLTPADFARVVRYPRAFAVGIACHFLILPLVAFGIIEWWGLSGAMAVGFMIIAACPTGTTSNLLTYYARGDVALALSFTAVAGVVSILTVPAILAWSMAHYLGAQQQINFPASQVMGQIFLMLGVPVAIGMVLRAQAPAFAQRWQSKLGTLSAVIFFFILIATVVKNWTALSANTGMLAPVVFSINIVMLLTGFGLSRLAGVDLRQAATVGIESSVQNGTLAIVIATTILKDEVMSLPGAIYGLLMYVTGIAFVFIMRRTIPPLTAQQEAAARAAMH